jgi:hypothetical protein
MKKIILGLAVMALAAAGVSTAHAGVNVSIGILAPVVPYGYAAPVYPAPVYAAPPVVYVQPAPPPVVVYSAPLYCRPVPRVYSVPRPVVRFDFGFGNYRHFYRHGCW